MYKKLECKITTNKTNHKEINRKYTKKGLCFIARH